MEKLFDPIRKCHVLAYPEEIVRQKLLHFMIHNLNYPKGFLAVEKDLDSMPHISEKNFSANKRRVDLICFAKNIHPQHPLFPLLLIECKAHPLNEKVFEQVIGYNHHIQALFVCVANEREKKTFWFDQKKQKYLHVDFLPSYQQLLDAVSCDV